MEKPSLLLVEDNPDDEELIRLALRRIDLDGALAIVRDGAEALDYLFCEGRYRRRDRDELPSVILLDLKLPKVSGFEVLLHVRRDARTRRIPVVILASSAAPRDVAQGYRLGANSYVRKPIDSTSFNDALHMIATYWLRLNAPPPANPRLLEANRTS